MSQKRPVTQDYQDSSKKQKTCTTRFDGFGELSTEQKELKLDVVEKYVKDAAVHSFLDSLPPALQALQPKLHCNLCRSRGIVCEEHLKLSGLNFPHWSTGHRLGRQRQIGVVQPSSIVQKGKACIITLPNACQLTDWTLVDQIRALQKERSDAKREVADLQKKISNASNRSVHEAKAQQLRDANIPQTCGRMQGSHGIWTCISCGFAHQLNTTFDGYLPCPGEAFVDTTFDNSIASRKEKLPFYKGKIAECKKERSVHTQNIQKLKEASQTAIDSEMTRLKQERRNEENDMWIRFREDLSRVEEKYAETREGLVPLSERTPQESRKYAKENKFFEEQKKRLVGIRISKDLALNRKYQSLECRFMSKAEKELEAALVDDNEAIRKICNNIREWEEQIRRTNKTLKEWKEAKIAAEKKSKVAWLNKALGIVQKVPRITEEKPALVTARKTAFENDNKFRNASYQECGGDILLEITARETRYRCAKCDTDFHNFLYMGQNANMYNLFYSDVTGVYTQPSQFLKNRHSDFCKDGNSYIRFPNPLMYKPIVYALELPTNYPVDIKNHKNLFGLLKLDPGDSNIAKKLSQGLEFLKRCSGEEDDKARVEALDKPRWREMKKIFQKEVKACGKYSTYDDWTSPCELCHHRKMDPSFDENYRCALKMLERATNLNLDRKGSPSMRIYRHLVTDHPDVDHSLHDHDDFLFRYLRAEIDARQLKRVGDIVYEHYQPLGTCQDLMRSIKIKNLNVDVQRKAVQRLKVEWEQTTPTAGISFKNGCLDADLQFHEPHDRICAEYIDDIYTEITVDVDYKDMCGFTAIDKHAVYAALGAVLLKRSTWRIMFEGKFHLDCVASDKKLFHKCFREIEGADMIIPSFECTIAFSRTKCIQSYILVQKHGGWTALCGHGESKIYDRLTCKPDLIAEFIASAVTRRIKRDEPGTLDSSLFKTKRGGAYTIEGNGYGFLLGRGNPEEYKDVLAMTLLDFKNAYETWCDQWQRRVPFREYFNQPKIDPIRTELARHNIVCINPGFDFTSGGEWKTPLCASQYRHRNYVLLGCCLK